MNHETTILDAETTFLAEIEPVRIVRDANNHSNGAGTSSGTVYLDANELMDKADVARTVQFVWRFVAIPDRSCAQLVYSTFIRASFLPDVAGQYLVKLEATTDRGILQYVTRVTVSGSGEASLLPSRTVCQMNPELARSAKGPATVRESENVAIKTFALSAVVSRRQTSKRRRPRFRRIREILSTEVQHGAPYGEPISSF